jgi:hypothetical protein
MFEKLLASVLGLTVAAMVTVAEAAMFYTDQLAFDAAVGGHLAWSENFEGFAPGVLPAGPLSIGGGQAEIFTDGPQQIITQTATGNIAYWNV